MANEFSSVGYTGTHSLTLDEFPITWEGWKKGEYSNIVTEYGTFDDGTYILYPTMYKGKMLSKEESDKLIDEGKHFGIYETKEDMQAADTQIHEHFDNMSMLSDISETVPGNISAVKAQSAAERLALRQMEMEAVFDEEPFVPDPLEKGEWERTGFIKQLINTAPLAAVGIASFRELDKSDLTPDEKFKLIKQASRQIPEGI